MADIPKKGGAPKPKPKPKPKSKPSSHRGVLNASQKSGTESSIGIGVGVFEKDPDAGKGKDEYKPGATSGETPDIDNARKTPTRAPEGTDEKDAEQNEESQEKQNPNQGALLDNEDDQPDAADDPNQSPPENPIEAAKKKMRRLRRIWMFLKIFFPVFLLIVAVAYVSSCVSNIFGFGSSGINSVSQSDLNSMKVEDGKLRRNVMQDGEETVMEYDENDLLNFADEIGTELGSNEQDEEGEEEQPQNSGGLSDGTINAQQQKIIDAANSVPTPGGGLCAGWVSMVFEAAGFGPVQGNADDQYYAWCKSTNIADLKPGMIVAIPRHSATPAGSRYGHVGIYVGGGMLMDNVGYIRTIPVQEWIDEYNGYKIDEEVKWGWGPSGPLSLHPIQYAKIAGVVGNESVSYHPCLLQLRKRSPS